MEGTYATVPMEMYLATLKAAAMLEALQMAGVDNWEGYSEAMEIFRGNLEVEGND